MAKRKDVEIIQVCFGMLDPYQRHLFEHVSSYPNRSGYLKRLIQRDMEQTEGGGIQTAHRATPAVVDDFNAEGFI